MPTPQQIEQAITRVRDEKSFIRELLQGALNWPVPEAVTTLEDISYDWSKEELRAKGLDAKLVAGTVKQIRLTDDQPWGIFLLEFKNEEAFTTGSGLAGPLRAVLRGLVPSRRQAGNLPAFGRENLLFICTHAYKHYRFAYFKAPADGEKTAPLAAFGWSPGEPCRTACELNLPDLAWPEAPADWIAKWAGAFDVEKVTKAFFEQYRTVFAQVEGLIQGIPDKSTLRLFTQRLFNRLMFIAFIQKKGWLRIDGMDHNDYLTGQRKSYESAAGALTGGLRLPSTAKTAGEGTSGTENFYNERLRRLFFHALNTPNDVNQVALGTGSLTGRKGLLQKVIGDVPYLNGGLFEYSEDGTDSEDKVGKIIVPDQAIDSIFQHLFARFNFTVAESTPLDVEVAVDPEMLGKVFEELVTGRHESGSYYTPKPIVSFMCREALKGYLQTKSPQDSAEAIAALVDDHNPAQLANGEVVLDALRKVRVCDPACGSGAYLLGMMHELLDLRAALFRSDKKLDAKTVYDRKLEIIQTNVYGVDLDPFATNTAMLRLWLSLAVEADKPSPLPNLDFKIGTGDSLGAPDPSGGGQLAMHRTLVDQFLALKWEYLRAHSQRKRDLKSQISNLKSQLKQWAHAQGDVNGFDWAVEFAEVFAGDGSVPPVPSPAESDKPSSSKTPGEGTGSNPGGFDIVLANPPYIRQELIKEQKPNLKRVFADDFCGTADLYVFFYMRALQLLAPQGMLAFISSNKWFRAGYGQKLRALFANYASVKLILDFHDLPVFASAIAYPMIFVAAKTRPSDKHAPLLAEPPTLDPPYPNVAAMVRKYAHPLPASALGGDGTWHLATSKEADKLRKMRAAGPTLKDYLGTRVYRGITTGFNEAFVIDDHTRSMLIKADPRSRGIIKPFSGGKDIERWHMAATGKWIIFARRGVAIEEYPAIKQHLTQWKTELQPKMGVSPVGSAGRKPGSYKWYEIQDEIAYFQKFSQPKIVSTKVSIEPTFALDLDNQFLSNTSYFIPTQKDALYALGVLNSSLSKFYATSVFVGKQNGWYEVQPSALEQLPIPQANSEDKAAIEKLVQKCLDSTGQNCQAWEKEIDERVAALYGL